MTWTKNSNVSNRHIFLRSPLEASGSPQHAKGADYERYRNY
jgi:hypothetical protein